MKVATPSDFLKWNTAIGLCLAFAIGCCDNLSYSMFSVIAFKENARAFSESMFTFSEVLCASAENVLTRADAAKASAE